MRQEKVKIPIGLKVSLTYLKGKRYLVIDNKKKDKKFISIPNTLGLLKKEGITYIVARSFLVDSKERLVNKNLLQLKEKTKLNKLLKTIETEMIVLNKKYRKKLSLKGLGYRMRVIEDTNDLENKILELKVGYSHLKLLPFCSDIKIKIVKKTRIIIESINKVKLGNFSKDVWSTRKPDAYKGKGFWFKYEKMKLKEVKKK